MNDIQVLKTDIVALRRHLDRSIREGSSFEEVKQIHLKIKDKERELMRDPRNVQNSQKH